MCARVVSQVYKPWDRIGLYGQDPANDLQGDGTYYCVAGHSGQGAGGRGPCPGRRRLLCSVPFSSMCVSEERNWCMTAHCCTGRGCAKLFPVDIMLKRPHSDAPA